MVNNAVQKHKVLIVEDNPYFQKILGTVIKAYGCHVTSADNIVQAIDLLNRVDFDLVFTNNGVDGWSGGVDILKLAKKMNPSPKVSIFQDADGISEDDELTLKVAGCIESLQALEKDS